MTPTKLTHEQINAALETLPGWAVKEGKLQKGFKFKTFAPAIGWMVSVAIQADKLNHHPDWSNAYNRVEVSLSTHDLGGAISDLDVELARIMEELAGQG